MAQQNLPPVQGPLPKKEFIAAEVEGLYNGLEQGPGKLKLKFKGFDQRKLLNPIKPGSSPVYNTTNSTPVFSNSTITWFT